MKQTKRDASAHARDTEAPGFDVALQLTPIAAPADGTSTIAASASVSRAFQLQKNVSVIFDLSNSSATFTDTGTQTTKRTTNILGDTTPDVLFSDKVAETGSLTAYLEKYQDAADHKNFLFSPARSTGYAIIVASDPYVSCELQIGQKQWTTVRPLEIPANINTRAGAVSKNGLTYLVYQSEDGTVYMSRLNGSAMRTWPVTTWQAPLRVGNNYSVFAAEDQGNLRIVYPHFEVDGTQGTISGNLREITVSIGDVPVIVEGPFSYAFGTTDIMAAGLAESFHPAGVSSGPQTIYLRKMYPSGLSSLPSVPGYDVLAGTQGNYARTDANIPSIAVPQSNDIQLLAPVALRRPSSGEDYVFYPDADRQGGICCYRSSTEKGQAIGQDHALTYGAGPCAINAFLLSDASAAIICTINRQPGLHWATVNLDTLAVDPPAPIPGMENHSSCWAATHISS